MMLGVAIKTPPYFKLRSNGRVHRIRRATRYQNGREQHVSLLYRCDGIGRNDKGILLESLEDELNLCGRCFAR